MTPQEFKAIRKDLELTQAVLARVLGVGSRTVRKWEAGDRAINPTAAIVMTWLAGAGESVRIPGEKVEIRVYVTPIVWRQA